MTAITGHTGKYHHVTWTYGATVAHLIPVQKVERSNRSGFIPFCSPSLFVPLLFHPEMFQTTHALKGSLIFFIFVQLASHYPGGVDASPVRPDTSKVRSLLVALRTRIVKANCRQVPSISQDELKHRRRVSVLLF